MKKTFYISISLVLLVLASCSKTNNATSGGSWTFKSQTYSASFCSYVLGSVTASTEGATPAGSLAFYFPDTVPAPGTYTVTNTFSYPLTIAPGQVFVQLTDTAVNNYYTISPSVMNGNNIPSVTVTKSSKGFVTITLPPVMMVNVNTTYPNLPPVGYHTGTDSSMVAGTIIQTQ